MSSELLCSLLACETDVAGALNRFMGNEVLYASCLSKFLTDTTIDELNSAISTQAWDDAFTAAHALKGLAGNMGFVPLFHSAAELVVLIRAGRITEVTESMKQLNSNYNEITAAIRRHCGTNQ